MMKKVLSRNLSAQLYSQIVTFAVQLGSVPFLVLAWGIESYGVWVLLTAIPAYLAFSDFGFTFIAKNDMAIRVSAGDREGALQSFQSILALLLGILFAVTFIMAGTLFFLPLERWLNLGQESADAAKIVLGAQFLSVLLYQFCLLFYAGVRCEGRAATETVFAASWRLADAVSFIAVALAGGGLALAALAGLGVRVVNILVLISWLRTTTPWLAIGLSKADRARISELAGPSFSYMLVPVSNALLIQGPIVILGAIATPAAVALFSVSRTVTRLGISAANMVNFAFTPEYSFAYGRKDLPRLKRYLRLHTLALVAGSLFYLAMMYVAGDYGIRLLSHGQVVPMAALTATMTVGVFAEMLWSGLFSPLSAVNAHRGVALLMATCSALALGASGLFLTTPLALAASVSIVHTVLLVMVALLFTRTYRLRFLQPDAAPGKSHP